MSWLNENRPFKSLLVTQFLEALNDNLMKFVFAALMVQNIAQTHSTRDLALSGIVFILPFVLLSGLGGYLADRFSKGRIIVWVKVVEILVACLSFAALATHSAPLMLVCLFLMGTHSAIFGPSKYGVIPELTSAERLPEANGLIQMTTYLAILLGQSLYGVLVTVAAPNYHYLSGVFVLIAVGGLLAGLGVGHTPVAAKPSGESGNFFKQMRDSFLSIGRDRTVALTVFGLAFFGMLGAIFQLNILLYAHELMRQDHLRTGFLVGSLTIGMGLGCFLAGKWSDQKVELGLVPFGSLGISVFSILLGGSFESYVSTIIILFFLGLSAGFYIVPLNTLLQENTADEERGKILGLNGMLSFGAMMLGAAGLNVLHDRVGLDPAQIFVLMGVLTVVGALYAIYLLPYAFVRFLVLILSHTLYRLKIINAARIPKHGGALLVCNHTSYLDAVLLIVAVQRPIRFLISKDIYSIGVLQPFFRISKAIPIIYSDGPKELLKSLKLAQEALRQGDVVCIFPEGQLTRTGNMLKFNSGLERVVDGVDVPIIPVHLDRVWGSIFSYEGGKYFFKIPKILPYPVTISFGQALPSTTSAFHVRQAVMELGADAFQYRLHDRQTLPELFWRESRNHPFRFCVADSGGKSLKRGEALVGAVVLSGKLRKPLIEDQHVGLLVPPSIGGVLANIAVSILGKVPVNLNYTASADSLMSVIRQCGMRRVITSKLFIHKMKIDLPVEMIFLEDVMKNISAWDRIIGFIKIFCVPWFLSHPLVFGTRKRSMQDLATVMFTSGSTGEPKGVMLTHANIVSNIEALYQVFPVTDEDKIMGILPLFHSFGFTATMWLPLVSGFGVVYHNNPLDGKGIGKLIHDHRATFLMATPTFLQFYIRQCEAEQFKSLKLVVVGAEKLKEPIAKAFEEKFGLQPMEGYGCTELSPIVAMNLPDYHQGHVFQKAQKFGTIGLPLPGIAVRITDVDTGRLLNEGQEGLLMVKGPNVMKGYLGKEDLTREVIVDGWYRTGDIAKVDTDGFIQITDRLSRFSKIGGEMVPHIKVEEAMHQVLSLTEQTFVVVSVPDEKKGEKLAVAHLPHVDVAVLVVKLRESGLPNLWIPSAEMFFVIESIPVLGTGKVDVKAVKAVVLRGGTERS